MITLNATISLLNSNNGTLNSGLITNSKNNVSADFSEIISSKKQGSKPFLFGASVLGSDETFGNGVQYYIGNMVSDLNGLFANPYEITITGNNITAFEILFDDVNNQYPTTIIVDGFMHKNDDANFTVSVSSSNTHTIKIANWNKPYYPIRIQGIYIDLEIKLDYKNSVNIERTIYDRSNIEKPCWGIIANTGNIEFNDFNEEIKDYAQQQLLKSDLTVNIFIKNTLIENKNEQIGVFSTDKWNYNNNTKKVSISLKDDLIEWQEILTDGLILQNQMTMFQIYNYLKSITPPKWIFEQLDNETENILTNTICNYPYLESGSLWNEWQKLCEICALYIYKNNSNNVVVSYEFRSN